MKTIHALIICILLVGSEVSFSQVGKPLDQPSKKPVLYDDVHKDAIESARKSLLQQHHSVTAQLPNLTATQKRKILALEKNRDRGLKQIDNRLSALNQKLQTLQNEPLATAKAEIRSLQSKRMRQDAVYRNKIRSLLTAPQKKVFDRIYK